MFTNRVLYKIPGETGLCIGVAGSILGVGPKIRLLIEETDVSQWSTVDCVYFDFCKNAMDSYTVYDEVDSIIKACADYRENYEKVTTTNNRILDMLSFKIHLLHGVPFQYARQQIWAKQAGMTTYGLPSFHEDANGMLGTMTPATATQYIDREFWGENRLKPLPPVPTFTPFQLKLAHDCVLSLVYACSQMKGLEDMSKYNMYSMNPISPDMGVSNDMSAMESDAAYANVGRVLDEAWVCGNITIDPTSAFWICLHTPQRFDEWELLDPLEIHAMQKELRLFAEVDPRIVHKVQAMMGHSIGPVGRSSSLLD